MCRRPGRPRGALKALTVCFVRVDRTVHVCGVLGRPYDTLPFAPLRSLNVVDREGQLYAVKPVSICFSRAHLPHLEWCGVPGRPYRTLPSVSLLKAGGRPGRP
jgi:hypothetical protein